MRHRAMLIALVAVLAGCGSGGGDATGAGDAPDVVATTEQDDCEPQDAWVHATVRTVFMCRPSDLPEPSAEMTHLWMVGVQPGGGQTTMSDAFGLGEHDHVWQPQDGAPCAMFLLVPGDADDDTRETVQSGEVELVARVDLGNGLVALKDAGTVQRAIDEGIAESVYTGTSFETCFGRTNASR